jgi:hypothetical protein
MKIRVIHSEQVFQGAMMRRLSDSMWIVRKLCEEPTLCIDVKNGGGVWGDHENFAALDERHVMRKTKSG